MYCIIKNKLNPAIMLYWDNQKSLIHFLPMPPPGCRLPECIFPMSSQPVSHWGGNREFEKLREKRTLICMLVQRKASPKPDVIAYRQTETPKGNALVTCASAELGDISWVFTSDWNRHGISRQTVWSCNGAKGHDAGSGCYTLTIMHHSESNLSCYAHGHNFILHPIFLL